MTDVLLFSRGKGRGHAVPDVAILDAWRRFAPTLEIQVASYSLGAQTFRECGYEPVDLDLPEDAGFWDTHASGFRLIQALAPKLVVSHEEFALVPVAAALGVRTVFLSDWFPPAGSIQMHALDGASEIIFLDEPGYQEVPPPLTERVRSVGPVLREQRPAGRTQRQCRQHLGWATNATTVVVIPGGAAAHSELFAPLAHLLLPAYDGLSAPNRLLVWVIGGADEERVSREIGNRSDVRILRPRSDIATLMVAADVVVTKGNRITTLECESLGVPSLSVSYGHNPIDDARVLRVRTNTALWARGLTPSHLSRYLTAAIEARRRSDAAPPLASASAARETAERLHWHYLQSLEPS